MIAYLKLYTTGEAAAAVGITRATVQARIAADGTCCDSRLPTTTFAIFANVAESQEFVGRLSPKFTLGDTRRGLLRRLP
jgi:hypothetical protein